MNKNDTKTATPYVLDIVPSSLFPQGGTIWKWVGREGQFHGGRVGKEKPYSLLWGYRCLVTMQWLMISDITITREHGEIANC